MAGKNKPKSVGAIIWDVVFWSFIVCVIFSAIFFKFKFIRTGSMKPTLKVGAIVAINPHEEVKVGDIAMYTIGEGYVIHRVKEIQGDQYIFQGDNVENPILESIEKSRVVGPVAMKFNFVAPIISSIYSLDE